MSEYYEIIKAIHIIAVISWMVGLLYLPRLFVYHATVQVGSETDIIFRKMERKLQKIIMTPAMIISIVLGLLLSKIYGLRSLGMWFHIKMVCIALLVVFHASLMKWRKDFENGNNKHSESFFRFMNEIPTLLMIISVFMVVIKPFE